MRVIARERADLSNGCKSSIGFFRTANDSLSMGLRSVSRAFTCLSLSSFLFLFCFYMILELVPAISLVHLHVLWWLLLFSFPSSCFRGVSFPAMCESSSLLLALWTSMLAQESSFGELVCSALIRLQPPVF